MGGSCSTCCAYTQRTGGPLPDSFPKTIEASYEFYISWSKDPATKCDWIIVAYPTGPEDIMTLVNWAQDNNYKIRPTGQRHNWSPLTLGQNTNQYPNIIILDNRKYLNKVLSVDSALKQITCQPGMSLGDFQENLSRNNLAVPHSPAPYDITMGGVLTINGHGTSIPTPDELKKGIDNNGSLSNRLVALTVVAWNPTTQKYEPRKFTNTDPEFPALQTALGRTLILNFTMQCVDDYFLRCRTAFDITWQELFPKPTGEVTGPAGSRFPRKSMAHYADKYGRAEIIWFPYTDRPWLKVWNKVDASGPGVPYSNFVELPGQFTFYDNIPKFATLILESAEGIRNDVKDFQVLKPEREEYAAAVRKSCCGCLCECTKACCCKRPTPETFPDEPDDRDLYGNDNAAGREMIADSILQMFAIAEKGWGNPALATDFGRIQQAVSEFGLQYTDTWDFWGKAKNSLIYMRTSTARVTANGYIVIMARKDLQLGMWMFVDLFKRLEKKYMDANKYPCNMPLEIRVTGLDHPGPVGNKSSPYLSGMTPDGVPPHLDCILWLDNLSFPGTRTANEFYEEMERELVTMYSNKDVIEAIVRPEWSKGWGYTQEAGAWSSGWFRDLTRQSLPNWNNAVAILDRLDPNHMFSNVFLDSFVTPIVEGGSRAQPPVVGERARVQGPAPVAAAAVAPTPAPTAEPAPTADAAPTAVPA